MDMPEGFMPKVFNLFDSTAAFFCVGLGEDGDERFYGHAHQVSN